MKLTISDARSQLADANDSMRELCESIIASWSDCQGLLAEAESNAESAYETASTLEDRVSDLEQKLEAFESIPALVDKVLGHEDATTNSIDEYNLRRAIDEIRSM